MLTKHSHESPNIVMLKKALINRNFTLLWGGQTISILGNIAFSTTVVLWIAVSATKNQSLAPLEVSGALLAAYMPVLLFGLIAGVFVDRWDARRTTLLIALVSAVVICPFLIVVRAFSGSFGEGNLEFISLLAVYTVVFLLNTGAQFFRPALLTLIGDIVKESEKGRAVGLNQLSNNLATIVAPPLATFLFFSVGVQWLLLIDMLSFLVSFLSLSLIHAPHQGVGTQSQEKNFLRELRAGLEYVLQNHRIVVLVVTTVTSILGGGTLGALDIFFLTQNLHASQSLYGLLDMAFGLGLVAGALLAPVVLAKIGQLRMIWCSQILIGICIVAYARMTTFLPALILLFFIGWPLAAATVATDSYLLRIISRAFLGRVLSVFNVSSALATVIGSYVSGFLASVVLSQFHAAFLGIHLAAIDIIMCGAGLLIILSGCYTWISLRRSQPVEEETGYE